MMSILGNIEEKFSFSINFFETINRYIRKVKVDFAFLKIIN
jgi:hypothetical protein